MNKVCCVGDANICSKSSSCPMVLRSACSHRHSRESSMIKSQSFSSSPRKSHNYSTVSRKDSCNGSLNHLDLSLHQIASTDFCESFEISNSSSQNFKSISLNVSCEKKLQLSVSNNSSVLKSLSSQECSSHINNSTLNSSSSMPEHRRFTRNSLRTLSDDETEASDITVDSISRINRRTSSQSTILNKQAGNWSLSNNIASSVEGNHSEINRLIGGSDGDSLGGTGTSESSYLDHSSVQHSLFDKFRWFFWMYTYVIIIRFVNFDVWLLSRIHHFGKLKAILIFLLPLLIYLVWGVFPHSSLSHNEAIATIVFPISYVFSLISSVFSSLLTLFSSISTLFSSVCGYFIFPKADVISASDEVPCSTLFSVSGLFTSVTTWLSYAKESVFSKNPVENHQNSMYHQHEDLTTDNGHMHYMNQIAALKDEIESLKLNLKSSSLEIKGDKHEDVPTDSGQIFYIKQISALKDEIELLKQNLKVLVLEAERDKQESLQRDNGLADDYINQISALKSEIESLKLSLKSLVLESEGDTMKVNEKLQNEIRTYGEKLKSLSEMFESWKDQVLKGNLKMKNCCDKQWSEEDFAHFFEKYLILAFKKIVDDADPNSKYHFFNEWINPKFHEQLMQNVDEALKRQSSHLENKINYVNVVLKQIDALVKENLTTSSGHTEFSQDFLSEDKIKKIVNEAIKLYDADKIGQVDYALESGGGSVVGTRCSETYVEKSGTMSIFGVPLWTISNSPRTAIQPDVQPGRCWAFKGSHGFLVVELSATIYPSGFTLEHIPVSLSPTGSIDSAPKNFSVWGLDSEKDNKGFLLGEYSYDIMKDPLQYFAVQKPSEKPYSHIELKIHSNHGNMDYTCLYRFRVHGKRVR